MTERDPLFEAHNTRWQGLVCARCNRPMAYTAPLSAWDQDHVEGADLALVPHPGLWAGAVRAIVVHPECVGEQE